MCVYVFSRYKALQFRQNISLYNNIILQNFLHRNEAIQSPIFLTKLADSLRWACSSELDARLAKLAVLVSIYMLISPPLRAHLEDGWLTNRPMYVDSLFFGYTEPATCSNKVST